MGPGALNRAPRWFGQLGVLGWGEVAGTIRTQSAAAQGRHAIADPRGFGESTRLNVFRVSPWDGVANTVTTASRPGSGAASIADPRTVGARRNSVFRVVPVDSTAPAVTCGGGPTSGALALADPMAGWMHEKVDGRWDNGGHYGIVPLDGLSSTVTASASVDSGRWAVADDRLPDPEDLGVWVIVSPWGFWHRGFTTLELAALQGLITPEDLPELGAEPEPVGPAALIATGESDTFLRQVIGNAVPRPAAAAVGRVVLKTLLAAEAGETFTLSNLEPWCLPKVVAVQLAVDQ